MFKAESKHAFSIIHNPNVVTGVPYGPEQAAVLNREGLDAARQVITSWPGYAPTQLIELPGLAKHLRVARLHYKDEGSRFGLGSFKPLGGAYAVFRIIAHEIESCTGRKVTSEEVLSGEFRDTAAGVTVCAATDGNHGRSVAWGARMFGCRCIIYINEAVTVGREQAIASYGAEVRRVPGSFDDAVRKAGEMAESEGWHVVPDTAAGGIIEAPRNIMQGYTLLADEAIGQIPYCEPPTHLFVQAGVGGLAGAVCSQFWQAYGSERPVTVTVEPNNANCWFESFKAGKPTVVTGNVDSLMAGLACGEISPLAWPILGPGAHAAMAIPDEAAIESMRLLAEGCDGDHPIVGGETGVAGITGLLLAGEDEDARNLLGLTPESRVVVIGSEGDTDPETYREIVGRGSDEVRAMAGKGD